MMKDDVRKPVPEKQAQTSPVPHSTSPYGGELTCSEGQVDDLLAEGESTESEEEDEASETLEQSPTSSTERKSLPSSKSNRKQK
jgi:hypothetical protein